MPPEVLVHCLKSPKIAESVQMQMILQSAPVLKNVKMSCMFTVPSGISKYICSFLYNTGIKMYCLCKGRQRDIVFLYREEQMEEYLAREENAEFLREYGYEGGDLNIYLHYLGLRISYYYNQRQEFPHETGVFLGYPLDDVKGFIENKGKNCSYIGYWKVYSDVDNAKKMFQLFDKAKDLAVAEFFSGMSVREIAC